MARFLAAESPDSGDWLLALPVTSCSLWLADEVVTLRLGCNVCVVQMCRCGAIADAEGMHGVVCKQAPCRLPKHQAINNVTNRAISSASIPITKEHTGLTRLDSKRPDGLTLILRQGGKSLTRDVTVVSTLADSYLHSTSYSTSSAAEAASDKKVLMYSALPPDYNRLQLRHISC